MSPLTRTGTVIADLGRPALGPLSEEYSRPAGERLADTELAARIRAVGSEATGSPEDGDVLTDGRVTLRQWRPEDAPAIVAGLEDGSAAYYIVGMPHPYGPEDASRFLARAAHERVTAEYSHLAVTDAATDRVLGAIGMNFRHDRQAGEIGYWTNPGDRAQGVALRAVALISSWAFDMLLLPRLELIIHPLNFESQSIASRSGFRREGLLRSYLEHRDLRNDYYIFARLAGDPAPVAHPTLRVPLNTTSTPTPPSAGVPDRHGHLETETPADGLDFILRPWRLRDAAAAQAMIAGDEQIRRWCVGIPDPCTIDDERQFFAESARTWFEEGAPTFAITAAPDGQGGEGSTAASATDDAELLGSCGILRGACGIAEVGYLVRESARGRGIASAALRAMTRWALEEGGFRACEALIKPENAASVRTAEAAGYVCSGESRVCCGRTGRGGSHEVWRYQVVEGQSVKSASQRPGGRICLPGR
jgi:RimJ/RimL family protein N-acetyltransferase